ncbi:MAG: hypothetical protein M3N21_07490 [Actinomycetota bacterium]|nr:hypothetical protein [Actinomycetota bacterium]
MFRKIATTFALAVTGLTLITGTASSASASTHLPNVNWPNVTVCVIYSTKPAVTAGPVNVYAPSYVTTDPNDPKCNGINLPI